MPSYRANEHVNTINNASLKYCNNTYVDGGCSAANSWNFGLNDWSNFASYVLGTTCTGGASSGQLTNNCGYNNSLIKNGGNYWTTQITTYYYESCSPTCYIYSEPALVFIRNDITTYTSYSYTNGIRPVIKLYKGITYSGGSGTESDPYKLIIKNG